MLGLRLPRLVTTLIAVAFLMIALVLATGPAGGNVQRFISTFVSVATALHPRIHFVTVPVPDLEASAKALEDGKVDIAAVRSDIRPPANGQTLVILRRDVIAIFLPPDSPVRGRYKTRIRQHSTRSSAITMSRQRQ